MGDVYQRLTKKGYDFYEVASAFQKSIRRGLLEDAMYWGIELYESSYAEYAWKRMVIMASEDVGLGEPSCIVQIMALKQSYDFLELRHDQGAKKLPFTQAVVVLVKSRKSRFIDHAITVYWQQNREEVKPIPDWAFDMHTRKGKAMGRGLSYFYKESCLIANANKVEGEEELEKIAWKVDNVYGVDREDLPATDKAYRSEERKNDGSPTLF
mgnify:FL=1